MIVVPSRNRRRQERAVIAAFEDGGVNSPQTARSLDEMGVSNDVAAAQLAEAGVLREAGPGRWYLDADGLADYRDAGRRRVFLAIGLALLMAALGWLTQRFLR